MKPSAAWPGPTGKFFAGLMDMLVDATSAYLIAQADAGAEALQLFESWAGTVPAGLFQRAVLEPTARIVEAVKAQHPDIPIIGFPRGAGGWLARYAEATGVDGIGVDQMTDMAAVQDAGAASRCRAISIPSCCCRAARRCAGKPQAGRGDGGPALHLQSRPWRDAADAAGACRRTGGAGAG